MIIEIFSSNCTLITFAYNFIEVVIMTRTLSAVFGETCIAELFHINIGLWVYYNIET